MKTSDLKNFFLKNKKLIFVFTAMLLIVICVAIIYRGHDCRYGDKTSFQTDRMQETEVGYPSKSKKQLEELTNLTTVTDKQQMRDNLENISKYLSSLDRTVTANKEELLNVGISVGNDYEDLLSYIEHLSSVVSNLKNDFTNCTDSQKSSKVEFDIKFEDMYSQLDSIQMDISNLQSKIKESIQNVEINNNERFEAISIAIKDFSSSAAEDFKHINTNISDILADIRKESDDQYTILLEKLKISQKELITLLTAMDEKTEQKEVERHYTTNQKIEDQSKQLQESLIERLNGVHDNIALTQQDIKNTLALLNEVDSMDIIIEEFRGVNAALSNINTNMDSAHKELALLIESVRNDADDDQAELLNSLSNIDVSFTQQNTQNYNSLIESLMSQSDNMLSQFNGITEGISDSKTELNKKITNFEDSMNQNYSTLNQNVNNISSAMSGNQQSLIDSIQALSDITDNKLSALDNSLKSVFQSVSDGKTILAAALLTKNVNITVAEDATFAQIRDAILTIPQKIVIGVEEVPGEIEYDYHYHIGDASSGGGCFTIRQYHQHKPSCYSAATCNPYCLGLTSGSKNDRRIYHYDSRFMHPDCGKGIEYKSPYHHDGEGCNCASISSHQYQKLTCGMDNSTPVDWGIGCGFVDGQIIGAKITYNTEAQNQIKASLINAYQNKGYVPKEVETENGEETEKEPEKETESETEIVAEEGTEKETESEAEKVTEEEPEKEIGSEAEKVTEPEPVEDTNP